MRYFDTKFTIRADLSCDKNFAIRSLFSFIPKMRRGDLTEGFLRYDFGGHIFGGAQFSGDPFRLY